MAVRARLYDSTSCPDFCGFVSPERWRNVGSFCAAPPSTEARSSGNRTANHSAVFVPQLFRAIDKLAVGESHEVHEVCALIQSLLRFDCVRSATLKKPRNGGGFRDRMCICRTAHAHSHKRL
ncbi:hypothetical protein OJO69_25000, partial [Escherichia coli]|nr:hypothetical protein [Escherichia coli]